MMDCNGQSVYCRGEDVLEKSDRCWQDVNRFTGVKPYAGAFVQHIINKNNV